MDFILDNYIIIIAVGLFFVFALIGYLIDIIRKNNESEKPDIALDIKTIDKIVENSKQINTNTTLNEGIKNDSGDELLNSYNENINE